MNWEFMLDIVGHLSPKLAVSITDAKNVERRQSGDIRDEDVLVLVYFVRIVWVVSHTGCKGKLAYTVLTFLITTFASS